MIATTGGSSEYPRVRLEPIGKAASMAEPADRACETASAIQAESSPAVSERTTSRARRIQSRWEARRWVVGALAGQEVTLGKNHGREREKMARSEKLSSDTMNP